MNTGAPITGYASWREFRDAWPGYNPRYLSFCWYRNWTPRTFRLMGRVRMDFTHWIHEHKQPTSPGVAATGMIIDHDAFTAYLWRVADRERAKEMNHD